MPQPATDLSAERLRPWLCDVLLPFWAGTGFDSHHRAFVEKFEPGGRPSDDNDTRVRVQARQIFVFSHAAATGLSGVGLACAQDAFAFLERHAWDREEGGWFHRLCYRGAPLDQTKDSYDHAFMLLALAWLYRAGGDSHVLKRARGTIDFLDAALGQQRDGAFDGYAEQQVTPGEALPLPRRQNPHMHLLEAFVALYEATDDDFWRDHAARVLDLFNRYFFVEGQLIEFFDRHWNEIPQEGQELREPGHFFEWTWLLHRYAALTGDDSVVPAMRRLHDWAWAHGVDRKGKAPWITFETCDPAGNVLGGGSKRLWPQGEAVKSALAMHERFGDAETLDQAKRLLGGLFSNFASLERPDWREQTDRNGRLIRDGMPSSSLYHLYLAVAEAVRVLPKD